MEIYISNLAQGYNPEVLKHNFGQFGYVSEVRIVYATGEKRNKDFAVISLLPADSAHMQKKSSSPAMNMSMAR